jgi:uncharacterized protein YejL (UPF0352 family)
MSSDTHIYAAEASSFEDLLDFSSNYSDFLGIDEFSADWDLGSAGDDSSTSMPLPDEFSWLQDDEPSASSDVSTSLSIHSNLLLGNLSAQLENKSANPLQAAATIEKESEALSSSMSESRRSQSKQDDLLVRLHQFIDAVNRKDTSAMVKGLNSIMHHRCLFRINDGSSIIEHVGSSSVINFFVSLLSIYPDANFSMRRKKPKIFAADRFKVCPHLTLVSHT